MADATNKVGTYICTGCEIGKSLDIDALKKMAVSECKASLCKTHGSLCGDEGLALIKADIDGEALDKVVIAACSFRAKQEEFTLPKVFVERVNLREGVAWISAPNDEDTQMLAEDYLRMGTEKARRARLPDPYQEGDFNKGILVVGGGIAGLSAALEAAKAGYKVTLLEKSAALGGKLALWPKSVSYEPPYDRLAETGIAELVAEVKAHPEIDVLLAAEVHQITGGPCRFSVSLASAGKEIQLQAGALVLATGFEPYDATKLGHLGYGRFPDVVTSVDFEKMVLEQRLVRPSDGAKVRNVLFVQCAGSRDNEHLPYCSAVCCNTTMKQAMYLKEADPQAQAYVVYKDIRTPGQGEDYYRRVQKEGAVFIRGEVKELSKPNGKLSVVAEDLLLGQPVELADLDLVVLAVGMVPTTKMAGESVEPLTGDGVQHPSILKLNYRQGPELPNLRYGYPDSHFICFPYETRRTGIYAAGTVRRAMNSNVAQQDGIGAAMKAIQCVEMTARGEAVHPRAGDQTHPSFFMQRCTQCKRCTEECPFGAINEDEKCNPLINPTRCRRCGVCMGACPERIISFKNYAVDMMSAMLKQVHVPEEDEAKPRVIAFVCENDAWPALDQIASQRIKLSPYVRVIPLRCMGGMNLVWVADSLSAGVDGILFLGCKHGEDYQCHFIKGSELCATRLTKVQETLDRLVLESDRVRFEQISMRDVARLPQIIESFMERIEAVGPNPYKGF